MLLNSETDIEKSEFKQVPSSPSTEATRRTFSFAFPTTKLLPCVHAAVVFFYVAAQYWIRAIINPLLPLKLDS